MNEWPTPEWLVDMPPIHESELPAPTRHCADCGETFTPLTDHAIRCRECAAVKYLG